MTTFVIEGRCPTKASTKSDGDIGLVVDYLRGVLREYDSQQIAAFVHEGAPASKARARWSKRGHFYTPDKTSGAQSQLAWKFRQAIKGEAWQGNIAIAVVFYRPNSQRIDADNLMKLVMDAGTEAGIWRDDCQVTHQICVVEKDAARPRTVIALSPVESSLNRNVGMDFTCENCAKVFSKNRVAYAKRGARFCSPECRKQSNALKTQAKCPRCELIFQRSRSAQRYCSDDCRMAPGAHRKPNKNQRPPALCGKCGIRVSRREYLFCAGCRMKGRKPGSKNLPKVTA